MSEWVSVDERLPERGIDCLVFLEFNLTSIMYVNRDCEWVNPHQMHSDYSYCVTHWMPLPEPPQR